MEAEIGRVTKETQPVLFGAYKCKPRGKKYLGR